MGLCTRGAKTRRAGISETAELKKDGTCRFSAGDRKRTTVESFLVAMRANFLGYLSKMRTHQKAPTTMPIRTIS